MLRGKNENVKLCKIVLTAQVLKKLPNKDKVLFEVQVFYSGGVMQ